MHQNLQVTVKLLKKKKMYLPTNGSFILNWKHLVWIDTVPFVKLTQLARYPPFSMGDSSLTVEYAP